ncbi:MAG: DUF2934 domain-containing protein [Bryobacteraceae bacterium]|jgi:hypothetical protein
MAKQHAKLTARHDSGAGGRGRPTSTGDRAQSSSASIAALAYELWHARGCPDGSPETDWFQAEQRCKAGKKLEAATPGTT